MLDVESHTSPVQNSSKMSEMEKYMESDEHRRMRCVAFFAVVVSTVAIMASVITLPLVYNYVQNLQSHMMNELDFCKSRSRDMWVEIFALQSKKSVTRERREWLFGQWVEAAANAAGGSSYGATTAPPPPPSAYTNAPPPTPTQGYGNQNKLPATPPPTAPSCKL